MCLRQCTFRVTQLRAHLHLKTVSQSLLCSLLHQNHGQGIRLKQRQKPSLWRSRSGPLQSGLAHLQAICAILLAMIKASPYSGAQGSEDSRRVSLLCTFRRSQTEPHQTKREQFIDGRPVSLLCTVRRSQSEPHYVGSLRQTQQHPDRFHTVSARNMVSGRLLVCNGVQWCLPVNSWGRVGSIQSDLGVCLGEREENTHLSSSRWKWSSTTLISAALVFEENRAPEVRWVLCAQQPDGQGPQDHQLQQGYLLDARTH